MKYYKSGDKFILIYGHIITGHDGVFPLRLNRDYYQGAITDKGINWSDVGERTHRLETFINSVKGTRAFFFKNISDLAYLKLRFNIDVEPIYYLKAINKVLKKDF